MRQDQVITPTYLPVSGGGLYLSVYYPKSTETPKGWVLHVPAFAEEMNRSRSMVNRQARMLVERGFAVVVPDLYGTGDSSGDFENADWSRWQQDIGDVLNWIQEKGAGEVCLWGLRLGCLLALSVARSNPFQIRHLILWQSPAAGRHYITQFLRLRMLASSHGGKETTATLRERLKNGETLEIAGYALSAGLASQVEEADTSLLTPPVGTNVFWLEIATQIDNQVRPESRRVLESWQREGLDIHSVVVQGDPFWMTQETTLAPELLKATTESCDNAYALAEPPQEFLRLPVQPVVIDNQRPIVFDCEGDELVGVLHLGSPSSDTAVLVVVGGPQYRVGSHRQYVELARFLGREGFPVLRFDCRGMGDSGGVWHGYESIGADIGCAIDVLQETLPNISRVVIWGLCDAATAACSFAATDERVKGLVLLNPWVYSAQGRARAYLKYYYPKRLLSSQFWYELVFGKLDISGSLKSMRDYFREAKYSESSRTDGSQQASGKCEFIAGHSVDTGNVAAHFCQSLVRSNQPVLLILSGDDMTAAEFRGAVARDRLLRQALSQPRVTRRDLIEADHTFSKRMWRDQVSQWTVEWIMGHK